MAFEDPTHRTSAPNDSNFRTTHPLNSAAAG